MSDVESLPEGFMEWSMDKRQEYWASKRALKVEALVDGWNTLEEQQQKAINEAVTALSAFDLDYYELYQICDASIPNKLKEALWSLESAFTNPLKESGVDD